MSEQKFDREGWPPLRYNPDTGTWVEVLPRHCSKGHRLLVGWQPCACGGHRRLDCRECNRWTLLPPWAKGCSAPGIMAPDGGYTG